MNEAVIRIDTNTRPLAITLQAFQKRFPLSEDGVSTKYDLMMLFLKDDGYASYLGVTSANQLYPLRLLLTSALNRLGDGPVFLLSPVLAMYLERLQQADIPEAFRLSPEECEIILSKAISDEEIA